MKCKVAQRLAMKWYATSDDSDKQAYIEHRKKCADCRLMMHRANKMAAFIIYDEEAWNVVLQEAEEDD